MKVVRAPASTKMTRDLQYIFDYLYPTVRVSTTDGLYNAAGDLDEISFHVREQGRVEHFTVWSGGVFLEDGEYEPYVDALDVVLLMIT